MRRTKLIIALIALVVVGVCSAVWVTPGQADTEWRYWDDPNENQTIDFSKLSLQRSFGGFTCQTDLWSGIELSDLGSGRVMFLLDTDANAGTGSPAEGVGADFRVRISGDTDPSFPKFYFESWNGSVWAVVSELSGTGGATALGATVSLAALGNPTTISVVAVSLSATGSTVDRVPDSGSAIYYVEGAPPTSSTSTTTGASTTTTTTSSGSTTTTTSNGATTTTTASNGATTTTELQWWKINSIDMTETGLVPSFVSVSNGLLAWAGTKPGGYSGMYIYDFATHTHSAVPQDLPGNYYNPCSDGSLVVYQGARAGGYDDIYLYDTGNSTVRQLTHNSDPGDGNDWNPRLDDGRIVWEKHMLGIMAKSGIYVYDMNKGGVTRVFEGEAYHDPDIWRDYVVSVKNADTGNASEIVLYNLKTKESKTISEADTANAHPRIDDGLVVWSSGEVPTPIYYPWDTYQIWAYDIAEGTSVALTDNTAGNFSPSIGGGVVAWEQTEPDGIGAIDYVNEAKGTFSEGLNAKGPECTEGGAAWYGGSSLYYAVREANGPVFVDVGGDDPYSQAITVMADKQIIEGYETGHFGLTDLVTRQQFAKLILLTMAQWNPQVYTPTLRDTCNFLDAGEIERTEGELYAYHHVARATRTGLTFGYPDGTFRPLGNITRQQVITMIVRAGSSVLETPPSNWQGVLSYIDPEHGERIRIAEYNDLTDGLVGGTWGGLSGWDTRVDATRGEVAQMLYNLLKRLGGA